MGENVAPGVKRIVDKVKAYPDQLGTVTCFMVVGLSQAQVPAWQRLERPHRRRPRPNEMNFWYHGISGNPPKFRSGDQPLPHSPAWNQLLQDPHQDCPRRIQHAAQGQTARFSTIEDGKDETLSPIVVWIAVRPNTINAGAVRDATLELSDPPPPLRRSATASWSRRHLRVRNYKTCGRWEQCLQDVRSQTTSSKCPRASHRNMPLKCAARTILPVCTARVGLEGLL
ncbi:hypothetical protein C8F01DRAFT_1102142 [Mycena amicta]|nr:hypothetical protein C8F01DRAFT_1102142 [Mycena amicta]